MNCPACHHPNRDAARFCQGCGKSLVPRCASCQAELPVGARFCDACSAAVAAEPPAPEPSGAEKLAHYVPRPLADKILATRGRIEGERRQVTVMVGAVRTLAIDEPGGPRRLWNLMSSDKVTP